MRDRDTPTTGPNKDPTVIPTMAVLFLNALKKLGHFLVKVKITINPKIPLKILISDATKGLSSATPTLDKIRPRACPTAPKNAKRIPFKGCLTTIF